MTNNRFIYWVLQLLGWGTVLSLGLLGQYLKEGKVELVLIQQVVAFLVLAITATHTYRAIILKLDWLGKPINKAIPLMLLGSVGLSVLLLVVNLVVDFLFSWEHDITLISIVLGVINFFIISLVWTIIYFGYHYIDKSRKQEMKNLQLQSSQKESELSNLKNQLNPHFMFNAMNSIRALVDEDPILAKQSITQLSSLLRNTLQFGKKRLVTVKEELVVVNDYLSLEKIRFEERLNYTQDIDANVQQAKLPPLIVQTLIENAIKHGISKKVAGGSVQLAVFKEEADLCIIVTNDGKYDAEETPESGIGLTNARKRLAILFEERASLTIRNENNKVVTEIRLPYQNN